MLRADVVAFPAQVDHNIIDVPPSFFFVRVLNIVRIISLNYQFNFPLMPILVPVCPWFWQLREPPLWEARERHQTHFG